MTDRITHVLDTSAILAYGSSLELGAIIADRDIHEESVAVPLLCLAECYRTTQPGEALDLLDVLASQPAVTITTVNPEDAPVLGGWASVLGSFDLAHAAMEAGTYHVPLITSRREIVTRILSPEWPIIDL